MGPPSNQRIGLCSRLVLDYSPEKRENLTWEVVYKRRLHGLGGCLQGTVLCSRLFLALEGPPGGRGGRDKLDAGTTASSTTNAYPYTSATARAEARAPGTKPAAEANTSTAAGVVAAAATSTKTTAKASTQAAAKTAAIPFTGQAVCDNRCGEKRSGMTSCQIDPTWPTYLILLGVHYT